MTDKLAKNNNISIDKYYHQLLQSIKNVTQHNTMLIIYKDALNEWATVWQLLISIKKCQTLEVGSQNKLCNSTAATHYQIGSDVIPAVDSVINLGISIDGSLKFSQHISNIIVKAAARCHPILKCFLSKDTNTRMKAFKTYVRPLLEYNSSVWSPHLLRDINSIERVQRRFIKRLRVG